MIGVISYLPKDAELQELRSTRLDGMVQVVKYIRSIFDTETIRIVAQGYEDADIDKFSELGSIDWIRFETGIGASGARNILLKDFYSSTDKWLFLCDDDVMAYDYYDSDVMIRNIYEGKYDKFDFDLVVPLSPMLMPFKQILCENDVQHYYLFDRMNISDIPNMLMLRNVVNSSKGLEPLYYNNDIDMLKNTSIADDADFLIRCFVAGYAGVRCMNWIKKSLALYDSVIFVGETQDNPMYHRYLTENLRTYIEKTYGVPMNKFSEHYSKGKAFRVERDTPYTLPKELIYVPRSIKNSNSKKLF